MKILQIFGVVVAVHLLAFVFIFASPGCSSSPRNVPTPDATAPSASVSNDYPVLPADAITPVEAQPAYTGTPGRSTPTRPGSPNAAAIAPTRSVANVAAVVPYTIQKGDSLWSIAKKNNVTVAELSKANNLSGGAALQPGKKLMIPVKQAPASAPTATTPTAHSSAPIAETPVRTSGESTRHVVANGESLGVIARKHGVTVGELAAANNITDPAKIRIGQTLVIPAGKGGSRPVSKPASKPAPVTKPAPETAPAPATTEPVPATTPPVFQLTPPPPGQDLDAGLTESTTTEVPTIKVEEPAPTTPAPSN